MSASIWAPGSDTVSIDAESTNKSQVFIATNAQILFTLTQFTYIPGSESIAVFRNGQRLIPGVDWSETSSASISLLVSVVAGEVIEVVAVIGATSANVILAQDAAASAAASAAEAAANAAALGLGPGLVAVAQDAAMTGASHITVGTTAQRPVSPANGYIRYNTNLSSYEGYKNGNWLPLGGGATGGGTNDVFYENATNVTVDYTVTTGKNAMSAGPVTVDNGITVTVPNGSVWTVV